MDYSIKTQLRDFYQFISRSYMINLLRISCFALGLTVLVTGCTTINVTPEGQQKTSTAASSTPPKTAAKKSPAPKKSPFKPIKEVVKDATPKPGYIKTYLNRDQKVFVELSPKQLGQEFGMLMHYSQGAGVFNVHDGLYLGDMRLMKFERVGDQIYLIHVNPKFTAQEGSALKRSLEDNTGHSIVQAFKIAGEDSTSKAILIDATPFFVSDYANISNRLKPYYGNKPVQYDKGRSYLSNIMAFPKNVEIDVMLTYKSTSPPRSTSAGVSDYRSVPVGVRYSMIALPENPMPIRYADDRLGHFGDAQRDFSKLKENSSYVRYVTRWRLEPSDLEAYEKGELVEPKKPIVYYMDHSIPLEYRQYVKEGILAWNDAFEEAGFKNAIVVKEAPDDSTWSAEDARYSTIIWTAAHSMGYAIGPSQTDPRTGEILNADILISSTFVTGWSQEYQQLIGEEGIMTRYIQNMEAMQGMPADAVGRMCLYEAGKAHQFGLMRTVLIGQGVISGTEPMPEEFLGDAIRDLIMHEVGHTLGMRHNFKGSSAIPFAKLNDSAFTQEHGLTLSVMDYAATNIAVDPQKQGDFVNKTVGTYDKWAIKYAYKPFLAKPMSGPPRLANPNEEIEFLQAIASEGAHPMHAYNTDEDTHRGPMALDPLSNTWDLGSDPMEYAQDRIMLVGKIQPRIEDRLIAEGEGYQRLRGAVNGLMFEQFRSVIPVTKYIGGVYFHRDHKGDTDKREPFVPVSAAKQREALQLINETAFKPGAFHVDAEMLNKMTPNRYSDWSVGWSSGAIDFPIHEQVRSMQQYLLGTILDNGRLARMINNEVRMPGNQEVYTVAEMMGTLTDEIFAEVIAGKNVDSYRRNLQRLYIDRLIAIMLNQRPSLAMPPAPEDARSLARYQLVEIDREITEALEVNGLDESTRAHLMETQARIAQAMDAQLSRDFK